MNNNREWPDDMYWQETNDNSKYYIPILEDIIFGYEYEFYVAGFNKGERWTKNIFQISSSYFKSSCELQILQNNIIKGFIRVPYLTKEQIINEGWKDTISRGVFIKNEYKLGFIQQVDDIPRIYITINMDNLNHPIYNGYCKSINEFRTICKLLNI